MIVAIIIQSHVLGRPERGGGGDMIPTLHHKVSPFSVDQAPKCETDPQVILVALNAAGIPVISRESKDFRNKTKRLFLNEEAD